MAAPGRVWYFGACTMKRVPTNRRQAELNKISIENPPVVPGTTDKSFRRKGANSAAQVEMAGRARAESGANHARHHVARKSQA